MRCCSGLAIPLAQAVFEGTREVGTAVVASTLTTVAVFLPLVFVEGIAGQLFKDQALTITYALLASLLVALTVIPMILALGLRSSAAADESPAVPLRQPQEASPERTGKLQWIKRAATWTSLKVKRAARFLFVDLTTVVLTDLRSLFRVVGRLLLSFAALLAAAAPDLDLGARVGEIFGDAVGQLQAYEVRPAAATQRPKLACGWSIWADQTAAIEGPWAEPV